MKIQQVDEREYGFIQLLDGTSQKGKIEYKYEGPTVLVATHTEIDSEHRGEGLGEKLVDFLMDFVKLKNLQLKSECPYASRIIQKNPDYRDLLKADQ